MPLTVLSVAYPFAATGRDAVGGAEQILGVLDRALVAHGHRSVVVAHAESQVAGTLLPTYVPGGEITQETRALVRRRHQDQIDRAVHGEAPDLIHLHGIDFHQYRLPEDVPAIATLHLPPSWYPAALWEDRATQLQCVSHHQQRSCPLPPARLPVIENGVPVEHVPPRQHRRGFALVLGRICPEKNLHAALDAGTLAGLPVLLGGQVFRYPEHERYYRTEIVPRLSRGHRFLGPVGAARKRRLLRSAKCLLLPTLAPETSSLVAMEAMAQGTPVIAYPSGAIPEIVRDGVTGFLVANAEEMAAAIRRVEEIDPQRCWKEARERFSEERMVQEYFRLYERLLRDRTSRTRQHHAAV